MDAGVVWYKKRACGATKRVANLQGSIVSRPRRVGQGGGGHGERTEA